ncbi:hypothetical protein AOLI_G00121270, partial [Acnodon oligacanthus]
TAAVTNISYLRDVSVALLCWLPGNLGCIDMRGGGRRGCRLPLERQRGARLPSSTPLNNTHTHTIAYSSHQHLRSQQLLSNTRGEEPFCLFSHHPFPLFISK